MNCDELITLLRIYRGSFNGKTRRGSDDKDVVALLRKRLIEQPNDDGAVYCTSLGNEVVQTALRVWS